MSCVVLHLLANMQAELMQKADSLVFRLLQLACFFNILPVFSTASLFFQHPACFFSILVTLLTPLHSQMHLATLQLIAVYASKCITECRHVKGQSLQSNAVYRLKVITECLSAILPCR